MKKTALGRVQRIGIHDGDQCKSLCRQKSDPMNDSSAFASSLVPTLRLKIHYLSEGREIPIIFSSRSCRRESS
jgi:hypothetical protein